MATAQEPIEKPVHKPGSPCCDLYYDYACEKCKHFRCSFCLRLLSLDILVQPDFPACDDCAHKTHKCDGCGTYCTCNEMKKWHNEFTITCMNCADEQVQCSQELNHSYKWGECPIPAYETVGGMCSHCMESKDNCYFMQDEKRFDCESCETSYPCYMKCGFKCYKCTHHK